MKISWHAHLLSLDRRCSQLQNVDCAICKMRENCSLINLVLIVKHYDCSHALGLCHQILYFLM